MRAEKRLAEVTRAFMVEVMGYRYINNGYETPTGSWFRDTPESRRITGNVYGQLIAYEDKIRRLAAENEEKDAEIRGLKEELRKLRAWIVDANEQGGDHA